MRLDDMLASISSDETVTKLNQLLDHATVSLTWYGQRMVSVTGYEGSVEINDLAKKYLCSEAFGRNSDPSVKQRLDCYALWGRVQGLYQTSDDLLNSCSTIFKLMTLAKEFRPYCRCCAGDPMAIIGEWESRAYKASLREFPPDQFLKYWPNTEPKSKSLIIGGGEHSERWRAPKEMFELLAQRNLLKPVCRIK